MMSIEEQKAAILKIRAFDGDEIRWNISFDSIPEADMRTKLKSHGFKWSPRRQAWTRGAKTMSINTIKEILGVLK